MSAPLMSERVSVFIAVGVFGWVLLDLHGLHRLLTVMGRLSLAFARRSWKPSQGRRDDHATEYAAARHGV